MLVVPPIAEHRQTFILLHGRGDQADWFGGGLLDSPIPTYRSFHEAFPHARFVFPQAPNRRSARHPTLVMTQWFDEWSHDACPVGKEDLKLEGLQETTTMIHQLINTEIALVGASNIVLGGLSQGCAASLIALLMWGGEVLGGYVGMCGWLPFREELEKLGKRQTADNHSTTDSITAWLQEQINFPRLKKNNLSFVATPMFIGHGDEDKIVPVRHGRNAAGCLQKLGGQPVYREYKELVHWYNGDMLMDLVGFIKTNTDWEGSTQNETAK